MLFSSLVFLWYFLPIVWLCYTCIRSLKWKNAFLLFASIVFYAWGEPEYVILMLISIALNYAFGRCLEGRSRSAAGRWIVALAVLLNLGLLGYFKYYNFMAKLVNHAASIVIGGTAGAVGGLYGGQVLAVRDIALPIGISFYTFQALSYVIDVYRSEIEVQRNPWKLALYISFFPQLIAGPIVKYHDVEAQLTDRAVTWQKTAYGIRRFCFGLAKKIMLANTFAAVVDRVLNETNRPHASASLMWFTMLLYAMQIYFDFSGYSDMAIGLGKMFGFDFMENFNAPYLSRSVREFWRRWHISLSTWFREYVYIPLGGNRKGKFRTYVNLMIVFFATGLWHGAGLNFIFWGLFHGCFLVIERLGLGKWLDGGTGRSAGALLRRTIGHIYTLLVVLVGWMIFRGETPRMLKDMIKVMFLGQGGSFVIGMFADGRVYFWLVVALLLCGPLQTVCSPVGRWLKCEDETHWYDVLVMVMLISGCVMMLVSNTYNPFIYFRF